MSERNQAAAGRQSEKFGGILAALREKRRAHARDTPGEAPLERLASDDRDLPLASPQERLWFLEQMQPGQAVYNIGTAVRLRGRLDRAALAAAFARLSARHESLRTSFAAGESGRGAQRIAARVEIELPLIDLAALPVAAAVMVRQVIELRRRPFDLGRAPLLRLALLRLAERHHVLVVAQHHLVTDGWSTSILVRELMTLYRAFVTGEEPRLVELPIRFADYAVWSRRRLDEAAIAEHLAFWKEHLAAAPALLELPTDRPRSAVQSHRGARLDLELPPTLAAALEVRARRLETTLFVVLLAAFQTLLHRWSGQDDVVVGTPIANRRRAELQNVIGYFANTLALRLGFAGDPGFDDRVRHLHQRVLTAHQHQELPFERLVQELRPERTMSYTPLFQVVFAFQNVPMSRLELPELSFESLSIGAGSAMFDVTLNLEHGGEGVRGWMEYRTDLFDRTTMRRFAAHLRRLIAAAADDAGRRVGELSIVSAGERQQALVEWNDTARRDDAGRPLLELFAEQVACDPRAVALIEAEAEVTYGELERRANRLAHYLRGVGVGPEAVVAVALERSAELVVALVAVVKAGGAYLPLDLQYPAERLRFMLEDAWRGAASPVVLTRKALAGRLPATFAARVVELDGEAAAIAAAPAHPPAVCRGADSLFYLMSTSGSTGRPKGIAVRERAVVRLVQRPRYVELGPGDVFLQLSPIAFDAATFEIWGALLNGAQLVIPPPGLVSLEELGRLLRRYAVSTLWLTAGLFHRMVDDRLADLAGLRQLLAGGDVLAPAHVGKVLAALPGLRLLNGYGPTENTTFTCTHRLRAEDARRPSVPIGRPISGTTVVLIDRAGRPVPLGVVGELCAGGNGLARGYFARPALTAGRFVPDPRPAVAGGRLYRTGDLARWRAEGHLEFLGRRDFQIKLRGFRIELGEIESVLGQHPGVSRAVVVTRPLAAGETALVAYAVLEPARLEAATASAELRRHLLEKLPEYMVPAAVVVVAELPLDPNGKVDRAALPAVDDSAAAHEAYVAPSGPIEEALAELWREVLGGERVGARDDFFELGGHSLLAVQLLGRIAKTFGVELPVAALFDRPTVAGLAEALGRALAPGTPDPRASPLVPRPRGESLPLSYPQLRFWIRRPAEGASGMSNTTFAARVRGRLDTAALELSLQTIFERHEALRSGFRVVDGTPRQFVRPRGRLPLPRIDLGALPAARREAELVRIGRAAFDRAFDLEHDHLIRCLLVHLAPVGEAGGAEYAFILVQDHLITDGWSNIVFTRELAAAYQAFSRRHAPRLPELPVQYGDYALWQHENLDHRRQELLDAWLAQLDDGDFPVLVQPTDFTPPADARRLAGAVHGDRLDPETSQRLRELGRLANASLFITLLAAFKAFLRQWTGQSDLALTTNIAHRTPPEVEPLLGLFTNVLVLRTDLSGDPSFRTILERTRRSTLSAYARQDLPFSELLRELCPHRPQGLNELFPVGFLLQDAMEGTPLALAELEVGPLPISGGGATSRDLILEARSRGEGIRLDFFYRTDLFRPATIAALLASFQSFLGELAAYPDRPLSQLGKRASAMGSGAAQRRVPVTSAMSHTLADTLAEIAELPRPVVRTAHVGNVTNSNFGWLALTGNTYLSLFDHNLYGVDDIYLPWAMLGDGGRVESCFDHRGEPRPELVGSHATALRDSVPPRLRALLCYGIFAEHQGGDLMSGHFAATARLSRRINGSDTLPESLSLRRLEPLLATLIDDFCRRRELHIMFHRWVEKSRKGHVTLYPIRRFEYHGGEVTIHTEHSRPRFAGPPGALCKLLMTGLEAVGRRLVEGRALGELGYPWLTGALALWLYALGEYRENPSQRVFWHAAGTTNHLYIRQPHFQRDFAILVAALRELGHLPGEVELRFIPTYGCQLFATGAESLAVLEELIELWREELARQGTHGRGYVEALSRSVRPARVAAAFHDELVPARRRRIAEILARFNALDVNRLPSAYLPGVVAPTYNKYGVAQRALEGKRLAIPSNLLELRWGEAELLVRLLAHQVSDRVE